MKASIVVNAVAIAGCGLGLLSCATKEAPIAIPQGDFQQRWHLAHRSPPVYYPRAVPASHPMGSDYGVVILHGPGDASFFIPTHLGNSLTYRAHVAEALSLQDKGYARANKAAAKAGMVDFLDGLKEGIGGTSLGLGEALSRLPQVQNRTLEERYDAN